VQSTLAAAFEREERKRNTSFFVNKTAVARVLPAYQRAGPERIRKIEYFGTFPGKLAVPAANIHRTA
jgi:hypothetical protein